MPQVLKEILENYYMIKPEKVFPFKTLESRDVCYALYAKGKMDDNVPAKIKRKYGKRAGKGNIRIWKIPKKHVGMRVKSLLHEGFPSSEESFYNFIYVFVPEIVDAEYAEILAEEFGACFSDKKDEILTLQAEDLG